MVGNAQIPEPASGPSGAKALARTFSCTSCGASVTIRYPGQTMSVACESCHSVLDVTSPNYKVLARYEAATSGFAPTLALGSRGKLFNRLWEVIGYMVREDVASGFSWDEYLLFNPYYGYRWLTCAKGHWNFVTPIKKKPQTNRTYKSDRPEYAVLDDRSYRLYYRGEASVLFVLGEFYWRVKANSKVLMADFICPPYMLSSEADKSEINWSISEYIERAVVRHAFNCNDSVYMRAPMGVAPNQPIKATASWQKIKWLWMMFLVLCIGIQIVHCALSNERTILDTTYSYVPNTKINDYTSPVFTAYKEKANLVVSFNTPVDNSWFYISGELVNNKTGETYPFERSVEYYHGYDSDGSWSEGSSQSEAAFSGVSGGQYYLNLDMESGSFKDKEPRALTIKVRRDVPNFSNFFWSLALLSIMPCLVWLSSRSCEVARWADSDYSPYQTSD